MCLLIDLEGATGVGIGNVELGKSSLGYQYQYQYRHQYVPCDSTYHIISIA